MKKMIMFLSCMVMACSLHAASAVWGFISSDIMDSTGNYIDGGTAFLFLGTVTASESEFTIGSAKQLASGGQNAAYNYGAVDTPVNLSDLPSVTAGQAYTLILLEETGASLSGYEGNYILVNGTSTLGSDPMSGDTWAIMASPTAFQSSDWQTMEAGSGGAPEPTSGLLLLIGGSLLALRRKRA